MSQLLIGGGGAEKNRSYHASTDMIMYNIKSKICSNLYIPFQFLRSHSLCSNLHYSYILKLLTGNCCLLGNQHSCCFVVWFDIYQEYKLNKNELLYESMVQCMTCMLTNTLTAIFLVPCITVTCNTLVTSSILVRVGFQACGIM